MRKKEGRKPAQGNKEIPVDKAKLIKMAATAVVAGAAAVGVSHGVPTPPPVACVQIQQVS